MLTAMPFSSDRSALAPCCDFRTIGNLVADVGLPAVVPGRHLDGKLGCLTGTGLRDSRADDFCLLGSDRLSPVAEDRPHFCVATLCATYAGAPASWPS